MFGKPVQALNDMVILAFNRRTLQNHSHICLFIANHTFAADLRSATGELQKNLLGQLSECGEGLDVVDVVDDSGTVSPDDSGACG